MKGKFILLLMTIIGIICFCLILMNNVPSYYSLIYLLPLCSALIFFFTSLRIGDKEINVAMGLIFSITLIRYCIHPLIMTYGNFNSVMKSNIMENAEAGIFLMMYECFAIYSALIISTPNNRTQIQDVSQISFTRKGWIIITLLLLYLFVALILRPDLFSLFMSIFQIGKTDFTQADRISEQQVGSFLRIISTLFSFVFLSVRILFPIFVIGWLVKKKKNDFILLLAVFTFVLLEFMFITATFAESIISSLIVILAIGKSDKRLFNKLIKLVPFLVVGIIVFYFYTRYQVSNMAGGYASKYEGNNTIEYLSSVMNAYFTGLDNVAATFNLRTEECLDYFLSSAQVTIPFNTTIFGRAGEILPSLYNRSNSVVGQIPSTIGDGYFYFGPFLAPIFSFTFAYLANKFNHIAYRTNSYWHYIVYLLAAVLFSLGLGMYNEVITVQYFFNWVIPMLLIAKLLRR